MGLWRFGQVLYIHYFLILLNISATTAYTVYNVANQSDPQGIVLQWKVHNIVVFLRHFCDQHVTIRHCDKVLDAGGEQKQSNDGKRDIPQDTRELGLQNGVGGALHVDIEQM